MALSIYASAAFIGNQSRLFLAPRLHGSQPVPKPFLSLRRLPAVVIPMSAAAFSLAATSSAALTSGKQGTRQSASKKDNGKASELLGQAITVKPLKGSANKYLLATFSDHETLFKKTPLEELVDIPIGNWWMLAPKSHLIVRETPDKKQTLFSIEQGTARSDEEKGDWEPYAHSPRFAVLKTDTSRFKKIFDSQFWRFVGIPFVTSTISGDGNLILIGENGLRAFYELETLKQLSPSHYALITFPSIPSRVALRSADPNDPRDVQGAPRLLTQLYDARTFKPIGEPSLNMKPVIGAEELIQSYMKHESWIIDPKDGHKLPFSYTAGNWQAEWRDGEWYLLASPSEGKRLLVSRKHETSFEIQSDEEIVHDAGARTVTRIVGNKKRQISLANGRQTEWQW